MGTWGIGPFENDEACDWAADLAETEGLALIEQALDPAELDHRYLEAPEGVRVLCAGEVLAAMRGNPVDGLPDVIKEWTARHSDLDVAPLARVALRKIERLLAEDSELAELWPENEEDYPAWEESVEGLRRRLGG